ncbi:NUDIX hydrolase [Kitasatospora indigofera]|uniref:NUDIX hydrolase n=1 Tax=Kitasatospora indigofera TaxID=67307 RepID=UPI0036C8E001
MTWSLIDHGLDDLVAHTHAEGISHLAAAALIEHDGRFLLVETAAPDFDTPCGWDLPTGRIRAGETLLTGLERVLLDHYGLDAAAVPPRYLGHNDHREADLDTRIFVFAVTCTNPDSICHTAHVGHRWIDNLSIASTVNNVDHLLRAYYADNVA